MGRGGGTPGPAQPALHGGRGARLLTPKAEALFTKFGIYTKAELEARAEIMYETYAKVLKIEKPRP